MTERLQATLCSIILAVAAVAIPVGRAVVYRNYAEVAATVVGHSVLHSRSKSEGPRSSPQVVVTVDPQDGGGSAALSPGIYMSKFRRESDAIDQVRADFPVGTRLYVYKNPADNDLVFDKGLPALLKGVAIVLGLGAVGLLLYRVFWIR